MRLAHLCVVAPAIVGQAAAFPEKLFAALGKSPKLMKENDSVEKRQAFGVNVGFDPAAQHISTSGEHAFEAPSADDLRGPCPGLNALANHNCEDSTLLERECVANRHYRPTS